MFTPAGPKLFHVRQQSFQGHCRWFSHISPLLRCLALSNPDPLSRQLFPFRPSRFGMGLRRDKRRLTSAPTSDEQREAVLLVGAEGLTYEETAEVCGTKVG